MTKNKVKKTAIFIIIMFFLSSLVLSFFLCCQITDSEYATYNDSITSALEMESEQVIKDGNTDLVAANLINYAPSRFTTAIILADGDGNIINSVDFFEETDAFEECKTLLSKKGGEYYANAYEMWDSVVFEANGEKYVIVAYTCENQILQTLKSEWFEVAVIILLVILAVMLVASQLRIRAEFKKTDSSRKVEDSSI